MDKKDIEMEISKSSEWNPDILYKLCQCADMSNEWYEADGENFEEVIYKATEKLKISI